MPSVNINICIDRQRLCFWHLLLVKRLQSDGHAIRVKHHAAAAVPAGLPALFALERRLYSVPAQGAADPLSASMLDEQLGAVPWHEGAAEVTLDLVSAGDPGDGRLMVAIDGVGGPDAGVAGLLAGQPCIVTILRNGRLLAQGRPALPGRESLVRALDVLLRRTITVIRSAVRATVEGRDLGPADAIRADGVARLTLARFGASSLAGAILRRIGRLASGEERWRVGWRPLVGQGALGTGDWSGKPFQWWPDSPTSYVADPFPVSWQGRLFVFVEEYPYATGKGILSVAEMVDGRFGPLVPILERPYHLSYPQVFAKGGDMWMIPETGGAGTIELYRARRFPHEWELVSVLVEDVTAGDATLIEHDGRLWLFASADTEGAATTDTLCLWHAETVLGPWTPHGGNPIRIDARDARPAGRAERIGNHWVRPVQDCSTRYGGAMGLIRIDRLDEGGLAETAIGTLRPAPDWGASGVHTLNAGGGIETIDCYGRRRPPSPA